MPAGTTDKAVTVDKVEDDGFATFEQLLSKTRRTDVCEINAPEGGKLRIKLKAMGSNDYDELVAKHPAKRDQKENGAYFNHDTFAPALIAECAVQPKLTLNQATQLYNSPEWAPGELGALFLACQRLCNAGLDVPFNVSG